MPRTLDATILPDLRLAYAHDSWRGASRSRKQLNLYPLMIKL